MKQVAFKSFTRIQAGSGAYEVTWRFPYRSVLVLVDWAAFLLPDPAAASTRLIGTLLRANSYAAAAASFDVCRVCHFEMGGGSDAAAVTSTLMSSNKVLNVAIPFEFEAPITLYLESTNASTSQMTLTLHYIQR